MRSSRGFVLVTFGIAAASVALWAMYSTSFADTKTATYKGSKMCQMCHKMKHPKIVEAWNKTGHSKALQAATEPNAIVAVFDDKSPIKKNSIKWVLGKGIREQAYIGADMKVLPAQWIVADKKWETIPADDATTRCLGCHTTGYDLATKAYSDMGIACEACHGPGSEHMAGGGAKAAIVSPTDLPKDRAMMICGSCHSKGTTKDTPKEKTYPFPVKFRPGDDLTAVFVDAKPTTPGRNQEYSEFITSKHAKLGMTCMTCHDPHGETSLPDQLKKPTTELCLGCHAGKIKDLATHQPKAPAGATCGTCHMASGAHTFTAK